MVAFIGDPAGDVFILPAAARLFPVFLLKPVFPKVPIQELGHRLITS